MAGRVGTGIERAFFASRWLMAPIYLALVGALAALAVVILREAWADLQGVLTMTPTEAILAALTLIDLSLAANLLVIVILSGFDTFVSPIDTGEGEERPGWLGTVDFTGLKMKLIASIVAISAVDLLKRFMAIGEGAGAPSAADLFWLTVIHLAFVVSGLLLALMDRLGAPKG